MGEGPAKREDGSGHETGKKRIQVFDAEQHSLALRVATSRVKTWSVVYKRNG